MLNRNAILTIIFALFTLVAQNAVACSMCFFGSPNNKANIALRVGVLTLLIIVVAVLATFAKFFLDIRKRTQPS